MPVDTALLAEYEAEAETTSTEEFSVLDSPSASNNLSGAKRKRPFDDDSDNLDEEYSADEYTEDNEGRSSANNISEGLAESLDSQAKPVNKNLVAYAKRLGNSSKKLRTENTDELIAFSQVCRQDSYILSMFNMLTMSRTSLLSGT